MEKGHLRIAFATVIVLATVAWLAWTGVRDNKSYYVTITELQQMGNKAYTRHLRVAGNVQPGSIHRSGGGATFSLLEQGKLLNVVYQGSEPPPDTFKDDAQALAIGTYGHDGVFHATQLQAKCASKYAPAPGIASAFGYSGCDAGDNCFREDTFALTLICSCAFALVLPQRELRL